MQPIDTSLLRGRHLYLALLTKEYEPQLRTLARDERLWEFTKTLLINDTYDAQFDAYIAKAYGHAGADGQAFVIHRTSDDAVIGMTRFYDGNEEHKRVNIGYTWYVPEVWGQVYNKECKLLLLQYAFETWGLQRVGFEVAHQNLRSQKAVEKIGGTREGTLRKFMLRPDGSVRHTVLFSIIDEEWPEKKAKLFSMC
ncbi:GNAT family protein [Flaviaesturariibacter amylovorans]|uniref:N-acetyltransferase domain-containing protein n=1 Tax=Flaviaesturariibacter amylovorans TaxID=1084520 RepID=A0ABP8G4J3_9BACT